VTSTATRPVSLPYFLALPAGEGPWPGLVVLHEGGGLTPQLLRLCQRYAAEGYAAIAPDLFFRSGGTQAAHFSELMGALVPAQVLSDIESAGDILRGLPTTRIGVTGFCMGGYYSWHTALYGRGFSAAVGFYGSGIAAELRQPNCPTLLFFGGSDEHIPAADIERVAALHPDTVVYPDAPHGFFRDGTDAYRPESAVDAWSRTLAFFGQHLRSGTSSCTTW
jgi:carboxymethylenebutenolidase